MHIWDKWFGVTQCQLVRFFNLFFQVGEHPIYLVFDTGGDRAIDHKFPKMYLTYFDVFTINLGQMVLGNTVLTSQVPQPHRFFEAN